MVPQDEQKGETSLQDGPGSKGGFDLLDIFPWVLVFLFALLLRSIYLFESLGNPLFGADFVDAFMYNMWAEELVAGRWVKGAVSHFLPVYPVFLAVMKFVFGPYEVGFMIVQSVMGSAAAVLIGLTAAKIWTRPVGLLAGCLYGTTWMLVVYDQVKFAESFAVTFQTLTLFLLVVPRRRWWTVLLAGLAFALSAGARPNLLLLLPFLIAWITWIEDGAWKRRLGMAVLISLGSLAIIGPVVVRNYQLTGEVMLRKQSTWNLYAAVNPEFAGLHPPAGVEFDKYMRKPIRAGYRSSIDLEEFWQQRAWEIVREDPIAVAGVFVRRTLFFLNGREWSQEIDVEAYRKYSMALSLPWPGMWLLGPLGILGLLLLRPPREAELLLLLFIVVGALSILPLKGTGRYRLPTMMLLTLPAAAMVFVFAQMIRGKAWNRLAKWAAGLAVLCLLSWPDWPGVRSHYTARHEFFVALRMSQLGDESAAREWYEKAIDIYAWDADSPYRLGRLLFEGGRYEEARQYLEEALRREPDIPEAHQTLAEIELRDRSLEAAASHLGMAVELQPNLTDSWIKMADTLMLLGRNDEAVTALRRALEERPDGPQVLEVARVFEEMGDLQSALSYYGSVIEEPADPRAVRAEGAYRAGLLFARRLEDIDRARGFWQTIAERFADPHWVTRSEILLGIRETFPEPAGRFAPEQVNGYLYDLALQRMMAGDDGTAMKLLERLPGSSTPPEERPVDPFARRVWEDLHGLLRKQQENENPSRHPAD